MATLAGATVGAGLGLIYGIPGGWKTGGLGGAIIGYHAPRMFDNVLLSAGRVTNTWEKFTVASIAALISVPAISKSQSLVSNCYCVFNPKDLSCKISSFFNRELPSETACKLVASLPNPSGILSIIAGVSSLVVAGKVYAIFTGRDVSQHERISIVYSNAVAEEVRNALPGALRRANFAANREVVNEECKDSLKFYAVAAAATGVFINSIASELWLPVDSSYLTLGGVAAVFLYGFNRNAQRGYIPFSGRGHRLGT